MRTMLITGALLISTAAWGAEFKVGTYRETRNSASVGMFKIDKLKLQSLMDDPVQVQDVVVNEKVACIYNPVWETQKNNPIFSQSPFPKKLELGDELNLTLFEECKAIKVRVITDKGEFTYRMN